MPAAEIAHAVVTAGEIVVAAVDVLVAEAAVVVAAAADVPVGAAEVGTGVRAAVAAEVDTKFFATDLRGFTRINQQGPHKKLRPLSFVQKVVGKELRPRGSFCSE